MCYLVTGNEDDFGTLGATNPREYETLADARKFAEFCAMEGVRGVRVWLLTHSVEVQLQTSWKEHAKGLSGA